MAALALALASGSASAWPCDFLTGGGFIITTANGMHPAAKANFGVGGGCKHGSPTWGHLQYIDHGNGLNAHWTSITAYYERESSTDSRGRLMGVRDICGTARTNLFGDVNFIVRVRDAGEPGVNDEFDIRLTRSMPAGEMIVYSTHPEGYPHKLEGGNIQLHKPNPSTTGSFGGPCPARDATLL